MAMKKYELEKFKKLLFEEIINEVNRKQGIPITFIAIELKELSDNKFEGVLWCQERSPRIWTNPLVAEIEDDKVKWNANELKWYSFNFAKED